MFRTIFGVIDMRMSVLIVPSSSEEKSLPMTGISPRSGILFRVLRSSSLINPPMITVSPSRRLMRVSVFLVPNLNWFWPLPNSSASPKVLISMLSLSVTVLLRWTVGSMASLMPTSLYSKVDVTATAVVAWTVEVWTGILSPMWNLACLLFSTRTLGLASVWASESCLIRLTTRLGSDRNTLSLDRFLSSLRAMPAFALTAVVVVVTVGWIVAVVERPGWKFQPYFRAFVREISSISTSRMTSASFRSFAAMIFSTSFIFSGVSRMVMEFSVSFTYTRLTSSMERTRLTISFDFALLI